MMIKNVKIDKVRTSFALCATFFMISFALLQVQMNRTNKAQTLTSGMHTCFNRVTQAFTAMMVQTVGGEYLDSNFTQMTNDCFQEVSKLASTLFNKADNKLLLLKLNRLQTDTHWFLGKAEKAKFISDTPGVEMENSNVPRKYAELEELKMESIELMESSIQKWERVQTAAFIAGAIFLVLIIGIGVYMVYRAKQGAKQIEEINAKAKSYLREEGRVQVAQLDRLMERLARTTNTGHVYEMFSRYNETVTDRLYGQVSDDQVSEVSPLKTQVSDVKDGPVINLDRSFTTLLKGIQKKAFTHGVLIDADFDEDVAIHGTHDVFDQIIYNTMNYAIDSSMLHNKGRKIVLRSKTLADTVYLKMFVSNHYLSVSELEALNDRQGDTQLPVTLEVARALLSDINVKLEVRNKVDKDGNLTGCEFEFLFKALESEAKKVQTTSKLVSLVKGTKRDLLKNLNQ